jgi:hypothetical protein
MVVTWPGRGPGWGGVGGLDGRHPGQGGGRAGAVSRGAGFFVFRENYFHHGRHRRAGPGSEAWVGAVG